MAHALFKNRYNTLFSGLSIF